MARGGPGHRRGGRVEPPGGRAHWGIVRGAVPTEVTLSSVLDRRARDGILVHRQEPPAGARHHPRRHPRHHSCCAPSSTSRRSCERNSSARAFEQAQVLHHLPPAPARRRGDRAGAGIEGTLACAPSSSMPWTRRRCGRSWSSRFLRLCAAHGVPRPLVNEHIGPWEVDFCWPDDDLVVETDGYDFHRTAASRKRDAAKDAYLQRALPLGDPPDLAGGDGGGARRGEKGPRAAQPAAPLPRRRGSRRLSRPPASACDAPAPRTPPAPRPSRRPCPGPGHDRAGVAHGLAGRCKPAM